MPNDAFGPACTIAVAHEPVNLNWSLHGEFA